MVYKEKLLLLSWNHNLPKPLMFSTSWNSGKFILKIFLNIVHTQTQSLNVLNMNEICTGLNSQAPHWLHQLYSSYSAFCCDFRHPRDNGHDLDFHPLAPQETDTCPKPVCHGDGSQTLLQICRVLTPISCRELLTVTTAAYDPQQEFHFSFSFSEAFELCKSISLLQASWSHAGICSLSSGKPEELCPANTHSLKPHRPPQLQWGSSSCTAQPACVGDLLNKNAELNNFLMNGQVLHVLSLPHKHQFTDRSSAGTSPALSVPSYPTAGEESQKGTPAQGDTRNLEQGPVHVLT